MSAYVGSTNQEWGRNRIEQNVADLPAPDQIGWNFIPITPERLSFTRDLGVIINATKRRFAKSLLREENPGHYYFSDAVLSEKMEGITLRALIDECRSKRGHDNYTLMMPLDETFKRNRTAISKAFMEQVGYIQPLDEEITVEILLIADPGDRSKKSDLDNVQKTVFDAMDYRVKSADGVKLGIIADDSPICHVSIDKRYRRDGERLGFWYRVTKGNLIDTGAFSKKLRNAHTTEVDRSFAAYVSDGKDSDKWGDKIDADEWAVNATTKQKEHMRLALIADDRTPLDPAIARYYLAVRAEFGRDVASKFALDAQSEVSLRKALGRDYESILAEKDSLAADLAEDHDLDLSVIAEPLSTHQLEVIAKAA